MHAEVRIGDTVVMIADASHVGPYPRSRVSVRPFAVITVARIFAMLLRRMLWPARCASA